VDVIGLSADSTMEEAADTFLKHGYSRLPVFRETMDNIVGILHEKDFYAGRHDGKEAIEPLMKPAVYAPATLKTSKLLKLLQSSKNHMAVIVDEFGGTEGIVTLEDVLEELVGEIYDEHDDVLETVLTQEDGSLLVDGGADLEEILELIHLEKEYEADTVGGWVAEQMGQIPKVGEGFEMEGIRVQATRVWKRRVTQVRIVPPEPKEEAEALVGMNSIQ
jgi:CBS domain containing-hemolysin-like protein